jgi:hypothetical protein
MRCSTVAALPGIDSQLVGLLHTPAHKLRGLEFPCPSLTVVALSSHGTGQDGK